MNPWKQERPDGAVADWSGTCNGRETGEIPFSFVSRNTNI